MPSDKEIKKEFKVRASKDPDKYYATDALKKEGFIRKQCSCGTFFWTVNPEQKVCGDPACSGGFRFIGDSPAKKEMSYIEVWKQFARLFSKWGYTPIPRYPVVARWRDDTDFVQASIYDFQPYVVSGEVQPPANPLVVPQMCLRFNDIDNIGITGAHYSAFVMIGQHAFMPEAKWDQDKVFTDIHNWLKQGLGLPNNEITFHEDAWAGGGNFGPCMEYFSRGLELGNQVYMLYEQTPSGPKPLKLKVLDMGMGHERNAWFTKGTSTSYETTFPTVVKKLHEITGLDIDRELMKRFLPYSSYLNVDEVEDINTTWSMVADKIGMDVTKLKNKIMPLAALYSVAEHSRALLVALSDGALPSNVGGGYNLRILFRRALSLIDRYSWKVEMSDLAGWHADFLKPIFPELSENLDSVTRILEVEKQKYMATKKKSRQIVSHIIKSKVTEQRLLQLYDSQGIAPEIIREEAQRLGKDIRVPENFYTRVAELHEKKEQEHATKREEKLELDNIPETEILYYDDYAKTEFKSEVQKIMGKNLILERTAFYPTSGGQLHDIGEIEGQKVIDVFKQGAVIIHVLEEKPEFKAGCTVSGKIELERRKQLAQHHTATHIVNAAARKVLGKHINQAGAKKTLAKAHLDITHYQAVSEPELKKIENEANRIVKAGLLVNSSVLARSDAEKQYGMSIYQGGAVPGKKIRVIDIKGTDVEACGGTHLKNTKEAGEIKLLKSTKIQDGVVRLTFTAGKAREKTTKAEEGVLAEAARILGVTEQEIPGRAQELFSNWKIARKALKKKQKIELNELTLCKEEKYTGDVLARTSEILRTQPEHIVNTIKKFKTQLEDMKSRLKSI